MKKTLSVLLLFCSSFGLFSLCQLDQIMLKAELSASATAKDFGIQGNVYEIIEIDLLKQITSKLQELKINGKLDKIQNDIKQKMINSVHNPKAVTGITKTTIARNWLYDPSISLNHNLYDQKGRAFYIAGTRVNPLDKISLSKTLIFIDGSDEAQVKWALRHNQNLSKKNKLIKIILVKGAIIELMNKSKVRLYFDQNGVITSKFGISHVPATIEQEGKMLRIREIAL